MHRSTIRSALLMLALFPAADMRAAAPGTPPPPPPPDAVRKPIDYPPMPPVPEWTAMEAVFTRYPDLNRKAVVAFIRKEFPDEYERFRRLAVQHYSRAVDMMNQLVEQAVRMLDARQADPELYQKLETRRAAEKKAFQLARKYRTLTGEARQQTAAELRETLNRIFDLKQEIMRSDVARMEKELDELKGMLARREAMRKALIERRLKEMTDREPAEW